jgi:CxxC-x17-CxxC domain-containing protein
LTTQVHQWREARDRFCALLEEADSLEADWQGLFTAFPCILTDCLALGVEPADLRSCRPGRAEADFYFLPQPDDPLSPYGVVEIKRPSTRLIVEPRKEVVSLSRDAATAVAQAAKYASELQVGADTPPTRYLTLGTQAHICVVAGLGWEIARRIPVNVLEEQLRRLLPPGCRLVPFDVLYESLESKVPPQLHVLAAPWSPDAASARALELEVGRSILEDSRRSTEDDELRSVRRYAAICTDCGQDIVLPFPPKEGRPVLCRDCHARHSKPRY